MVWEWFKRKAKEAYHGIGRWAKGQKGSTWWNAAEGIAGLNIPYISDAAKAATTVVGKVGEAYDWASHKDRAWNQQSETQDIAQGAQG